MSPITTHVLDTSRGCPAVGVPVSLEYERDGVFEVVGTGATDEDGRLKSLLSDRDAFESGVYRITFEVGTYFARHAAEFFYPRASIVFEVKATNQHYHVPLLLSPYGYSTYRGS